MKSLSRCKVCGYIMETDKIPELCPACGLASEKVFEPYTPKLSEERYKFLNLHLHPIILHFPQAFVVTAMGVAFLAMFFSGEIKDSLVTVMKFTLLFLPLTVVMGAFTGYLDGKKRFRKVTAPLLKQKIILSCTFLGLSILAAVLGFVLEANFVGLAIIFVVTAAASGNAALLGRMGSGLMDAFMPGK